MKYTPYHVIKDPSVSLPVDVKTIRPAQPRHRLSDLEMANGI